jgi:hypothetical protein
LIPVDLKFARNGQMRFPNGLSCAYDVALSLTGSFFCLRLSMVGLWAPSVRSAVAVSF